MLSPSGRSCFCFDVAIAAPGQLWKFESLSQDAVYSLVVLGLHRQVLDQIVKITLVLLVQELCRFRQNACLRFRYSLFSLFNNDLLSNRTLFFGGLRRGKLFPKNEFSFC